MANLYFTYNSLWLKQMVKKSERTVLNEHVEYITKVQDAKELQMGNC